MRDDSVSTFTVTPEDVGIERGTPEDLRGGDAAHNADVVRRVVAGEPGPIRDAVLLNAGAALAVHSAGHSDSVEALRVGIERAAESVDSGKAAAALDAWVNASTALADR